MPNDDVLQILLSIKDVESGAYRAGYKAGYLQGLTEGKLEGLDRGEEILHEVLAKEDSPDASDEK